MLNDTLSVGFAMPPTQVHTTTGSNWKEGVSVGSCGSGK